MKISEQVKHLKELGDATIANMYSFEELSLSLKEAADTIEALSAKLEKANEMQKDTYLVSNWTPASQLPETQEDVLIQYPDGKMGVGWFCKRQKNWWTCIGMDPVAWRPLPEKYHEPQPTHSPQQNVTQSMPGSERKRKDIG